MRARRRARRRRGAVISRREEYPQKRRYLASVGDLSEFSLKIQLFLKTYRWRRIDPVPWTPLSKPLSACRVALVSSAGFVAPGQEPFDEKKKGGDPTFREISDN